MNELRYTLLTDGSSDKTLMNIIQWSLDDIFPKLPCAGRFADLRLLKNPPSAGDVVQRIKVAENLHPFDILFYHRDAEYFDKDVIQKRKKGKNVSRASSRASCCRKYKGLQSFKRIVGF